MTLDQLIGERGIPSGDLAELLGPGATVSRTTGPRTPGPMAPQRQQPAPAVDERPIVPIESLAPDTDAVPVESLVYQGEAALRRAMDLKPQLIAAQGDATRFNELIREVFDLVELGLGSPR